VLGILAVQSLLSLRMVWSNTAFNDEALYLWSGHWEIAHLVYGTPIPQFQTYFSGAPVIYPVVGAIADSYGGLALARLLSLAFMLGATLLLYATGRRLFSYQAALIGTALYAVLGPVQFLGAFATYDAMALFCLALSAYLVVRARGPLSEFLLLAAAIALALANATKYATGLWDPVIVVLAGVTAPSGGWARGLLRGARLAGYVAGILLWALRLGGHPYVAGVMGTTLARQPGTTSAVGILRESGAWIGIVLVIAMRAVVIAPSARAKLLSAALAGAALLAPLNQARIHVAISLDKHVAFGAWFAAAAAGYVLAHAVDHSKYSGWRIPAATVAVVAVFGTLQATYFHDGWANSRSAITRIGHMLGHSHGRVLAESGPVAAYYLHLTPGQIVNASAFYYWDPRLRRGLRGSVAYTAAIRNHAFTVVEVDHASVRGKYGHLIASVTGRTAGYRLMMRLPWRSSLGHESFLIWRYAPGRGHRRHHGAGPRHHGGQR
jgi:4-amino-4-deoxy-L-arabinose transferase-like glycosyltransferase